MCLQKRHLVQPYSHHYDVSQHCETLFQAFPIMCFLENVTSYFEYISNENHDFQKTFMNFPKKM